MELHILGPLEVWDAGSRLKETSPCRNTLTPSRDSHALQLDDVTLGRNRHSGAGDADVLIALGVE